MIDTFVQELINRSDHFITFKDTNHVIQYAHEHSIFFFQGIPDVKTRDDIIGTDILWYAKRNKNVTKQFIKEQNIVETFTMKMGKGPAKQKDVSLILANNKLVMFNRWQEPFIQNKKIVGLLSHVVLKNFSNTLELYDEYLRQYPTVRDGKQAFIDQFKLNEFYPDMNLSDSMMREILMDYEMQKILSYAPKILPQVRANNRMHLRKNLSPMHSIKTQNQLFAKLLNQSRNLFDFEPV